MTNTMTYDQAVKVYTDHVKARDDQSRRLVANVNTFIKTTRKTVETNERAKEKKELAGLDKKLKRA